MITNIVLFSTLGYLLSVLGIETWSAPWWCLVGLFMAHGWHQNIEGYDQGLEHSLIVINRLEQHINKNKDTTND